MRKRRRNLLQKAMAVLLSAVLCIGLLSGAEPMDAQAADDRTQTAFLIVEFDGCTEVPSVQMDVHLQDSDNNVYTPSVSGQTGSLTYVVENLVRDNQYSWIIDGTAIPFKKDSAECTVVRTLYSVNFVDGSNVLYTQYVAYGGKATRPSTNPTKPDYTFEGWRDVYGREFSFDTYIIQNSTRVYAKWRQIVTNEVLAEQIDLALNQITITNSTTKEYIESFIKARIKQNLDIESTVTVDIINRTLANSQNTGTIDLKVSAAYEGYSASKDKSISTPIQGTDWTLDRGGNLIISSQEGMNDWASNGGRINNLSNVKTVNFDFELTEIPANAFKDCAELRTVYYLWASKVTSIGNSAFAGASSLSEIELPETLQSIGDGAFSGCSSLNKVKMRGDTPPTFTGNSIFDGCKFVTDPDNAIGIMVPSGKGEAYINAAGDYGKYVIEEAAVPKPKPQVTQTALREKLQQVLDDLPVSNATTMDTAMQDVKKALDDHFANQSTIQAGVFAITRANYEEEGLIILEVTAYCGGYSVTGQVTKSVPKLLPEQDGNWALDEDGGLVIFGQTGMDEWVQNGRTQENLPAVKNVLLQGDVTKITDNAFNGCGNLESVTMPDSVTSIGNSAFAGAASLSGVTLPPNLQGIGDSAFAGCGSLEKVIMQGTTPPTSVGNAVFDGCKFVTDTASTGGIIVPSGSAEEYNKVAGGVWGAYVTEGGLPVTEGALRNKLQEVVGMLTAKNDTTPEEIINIVKSAIDGYFGADSTVRIAAIEHVKATMESDGYLKLSIVTDCQGFSVSAERTILIAKLPGRGWTLDEAGNLVIDSQAGMDDWVLNGRAEGRFPGVKNILIQGDVTDVLDDAFSGCCDLISIVIPDTVTSIGSLAFKHASSLSEITLPPNLQSIGDSAFSDCSSLEKVVMQGETPPTIGVSVFEECKFVMDNSKGIIVPKDRGDAYKAAMGVFRDNILEKHVHSFGTVWIFDGVNHWHECACGVKADTAAHAWGNGVVVAPPTETEAGIMGYVCSVCLAAKTEPIPATGSGNPSVSGNDNPSVSGNGNQGSNPSVSGNDNPSVSGNDSPNDSPNGGNSGGGTSGSGNDNPDSGNPGSSGSSDSGNLQQSVNSGDLALFWNALTANTPKDAEPRTADGVPVELYATVAMIAGFFYLLLLFLDKYDITEEERRENLARLVRWAKCGGWFRRLPVMAVLLVMRTYYRIMGGQQSKGKKI